MGEPQAESHPGTSEPTVGCVLLAVILAACRVTGIGFSHLCQSQVVSELIAGVLLGPSLLGSLATATSAYLLPVESSSIG